MKSKSPRRLYFSILADSRITVCEYLYGQRHRVLPPFKEDDEQSIKDLKQLIAFFRIRNKRDVVATQDYIPSLLRKLDIKHEHKDTH